MPYSVQLQEIANRERKVLEIDLDDVFNHKNDEEFLANIKRNTKRYVSVFSEKAMDFLPMPTRAHRTHDVIDNLVAQRTTQLEAAREAGVPVPEGADVVPSFITKLPRKLRDVRASDIGSLVTVKGMVTRANDVKPQIVGCTYICDTCGSELYQPVNGFRCKDNKTTGKINMMSRGSKFIKYQELRLQELPDQVPIGHIPRAITVQCKGEAARQCGPGDIVTISGIFLAQRKEKQTYADLTMGLDSDAQRIVTEISMDADPYARLSASIAPEIFGHDDVKKALLLQLVGGVTRNLDDGMKIRGDINICLMGDPGVAKSQLLKYIATAAPRGVYTTGKGSSGVGLTAAVLRDPVTGDLSLEGGALVLADKGICCIDEFDKMQDSDRTAIHEVMEQQTISIAKAGITTSLNARAAVLAAANPLYGRYNKRKSVSENVDLPNSLLSRFDLLFLLLDKVDLDNDLALSRHVLHVHKYLKKPASAVDTLSATQVKQYISIARTIDPTVPYELTQYIAEAFVNQAVMTAPLARLRLSNEISHEDVDEAMRLTHASKASLADDGPSTRQEDTVSEIYSMMRDFAAQRNTNCIEYNHLELMILKKGFSNQQLRTCIEEYASLGVLTCDENFSKITFD
eukprot:GSChrysophyteH1.ASY1.ANO1.2152.1 assembled CDS